MVTAKKNQVDDLMSIGEAAEIARCSRRTIKARMDDGVLPYYRVGPRLIRISSSDLQAWLASGRVSAKGSSGQKDPSRREQAS